MPLDLYLHSTDKQCSKYDHKWTDYMTYSTVNGINLLCSTGGPKLVQYFWKSFVIMCFVCSLSMIVHNVAIYTRKEVMNSMKIENEKEVDFPAITICNQLINKRVPTCDFPEIAQFARYLSLTPRLEGGTWTDKLQQEYSKYCPCPKDYNMRTSAAAFEDFQQKDYYESLNEYSPSIADQFAYCQLNKHKVNCTDIFGGHLTDIGLCATFNMIHSEAINVQANLLGDFGGLSAAAKSKNIQVNESGPNTGLKIMLKVRKRDYCGTSRKWTGIGYHVAVHQQNHILPLHFLNDFRIKFYPGYVYQIGMKITGRPKFEQCLWISFMILCMLSSTCIITQNILLYKLKGVKNSIKIQDEDKIDFPAITVCNQLVNKRLAACDFPGLGQFSRYLSLMPQLEYGVWTDSVEQEYAKYCRCPSGYKKRTTAEAFDDFQKKDYYESLNEYSPSIDDQFAFCRLKGLGIKCTDIFGSHLTDIGLCATFNMIHSEAINTQASSLGSFGGLSAAVKGTNIQVNRSGINTGLNFVLKTMRNNYCGNLRKWTGDGFHIAIHQQTNVMPLHFLGNFRIKFHPGYSYHIGIRVSNIVRHTEHLNRCNSKFLNLNTGGHSSGITYDQSTCLVTCLFRLVYRKCNCFSRVFESLEALITRENMNLADINMSTPWCRRTHQTDFCDLTNIVRWRQDDFQLNNCTYCTPYCVESQYATTVTETKINDRFISDNDELCNETIGDLIVANFYLESMSVTYIYEDQAFTLEDLTIYVANILNLFFGMSFLTMFELLLEGVLCFHARYASLVYELYHKWRKY